MQSSDVSDALDGIGTRGALSGFFPVIEGKAIEGEAVPVLVRKSIGPRRMKADLIQAIRAGARGSILVISSESDSYSVWGGHTSWYANRLRLGGVVVDGGVRDVAEIRKMGFPVFAKKRTPVSGSGRLEVAAVGEPVKIDGIVVRKGDWVVADSDGVVVIPRTKAGETRRRVAEIKDSESRDRKELTSRKSRGNRGPHRPRAEQSPGMQSQAVSPLQSGPSPRDGAR
jgi:3-hexulose-6-phosphate synthase/6-phospho-3-hexuloisomerase